MLEAADRQAELAPAPPLHGHSPVEKVSLLPALFSTPHVHNFQGASEGSAQPKHLTHAYSLPLGTPVSWCQAPVLHTQVLRTARLRHVPSAEMLEHEA